MKVTLLFPQKLQDHYRVGKEVEAQATTDDDLQGGTFTFKNLDGREITVDQIELSRAGAELGSDFSAKAAAQ